MKLFKIIFIYFRKVKLQKLKMKKFGRQSQYYQGSKSINNINNDDILYENQLWNNDFEYEDPVDTEFFNQFQEKYSPFFEYQLRIFSRFYYF